MKKKILLFALILAVIVAAIVVPHQMDIDRAYDEGFWAGRESCKDGQTAQGDIARIISTAYVKVVREHSRVDWIHGWYETHPGFLNRIKNYPLGAQIELIVEWANPQERVRVGIVTYSKSGKSPHYAQGLWGTSANRKVQFKPFVLKQLGTITAHIDGRRFIIGRAVNSER